MLIKRTIFIVLATAAMADAQVDKTKPDLGWIYYIGGPVGLGILIGLIYFLHGLIKTRKENRLQSQILEAIQNVQRTVTKQGEAQASISLPKIGKEIRAEIGDALKEVEVYVNEAERAMAKGDFRAATEAYNKATNKVNVPGLRFNLAFSLQLCGELDLAIAEYTEVINLKPDHFAAYHNRGVAKYEKGDYDGAIADYDEVIKLNPKDTEAYNNRGVAKIEKGDYDGAIADYDEAIKLNPEDAKAYNNRGNKKRKEGDYDDAIADLTKAINLFTDDNDKAAVYYNIGSAKGEKGDYDDAIADLTKAINLFTDDNDKAEAYINRGAAKGVKGNAAGTKEETRKWYKKAIEDFKDALRLKPEYENAKIALKLAEKALAELDD